MYTNIDLYIYVCMYIYIYTHTHICVYTQTEPKKHVKEVGGRQPLAVPAKQQPSKYPLGATAGAIPHVALLLDASSLYLSVAS